MTLEEQFLTILMLIGPPPDRHNTGSYLVYFHAYTEARKQVGLEDGLLSYFHRWCEDRKHCQQELPPAD